MHIGGIMSRPIQQSITLSASPRKLFNTFIDSKKHTAPTGAPAELGREVGAPVTAFGGQLVGRNWLVVPGRLIVQAWRSKEWKASDPDSILILEFSKTKGGGRIDLVHVGVPEHDHKGVMKGWKKYYWTPWKKRLAKL
jgi:activator of HSP90 ATPase